MISPFTKVIYNLIGNYKEGKITCIYGNAASGKTTCCLLASIAAAKIKGKIIYVDTEGKFDSDRLQQLYFTNVKEILDNILLIQPKSFEEQDKTIQKVKKLCEQDSVKLIIVDTIGHHYRNIVNEDHKNTNKIMAEQMAQLVRIARDLKKVVLITNQASANLEDKEKLNMVGGKLIKKMCKVIVELRKENDIRTAKLIKYKTEDDTVHKNINKKIEFEMKEKGLYTI